MNKRLITDRSRRWLTCACAVTFLPLAPLAASVGQDGQDACREAAQLALLSCRNEASSSFWLERAKCANLLDPDERLQCTQDAFEELKEEVGLCWERRSARLELCDALGGGVYAPQIDPALFVAVVDNPYLPLLPGTTRIYESTGGDETERIEVSVLDETKEILGVECTVVRDVVYVDGEPVEDTLDWFAQDLAGNVWYFGEISKEYEDGELVGLEGSWQAGEDGAHPGIVMPAAPQVGDLYRQEFLLREAEDVGAVLGLDATVTVPYGTFSGCLWTEDYTPLEPDVLENKYYALGIGVVLEVDLESGERVELIDVQLD